VVRGILRKPPSHSGPSPARSKDRIALCPLVFDRLRTSREGPPESFMAIGAGNQSSAQGAAEGITGARRVEHVGRR
jgi:hypothetical protein